MDVCEAGNDFNGLHMGARISSVFVIGVASALGAFFPVLASQYSFVRMPGWCFFAAKYFGSGVIVATAFIHLLSPANESLTHECLGGAFGVYPMAFGICLIVLMTMFFLELIAYRWIENKVSGVDQDAPHTHSHFGETNLFVNSDHLIADAEHNAQHVHTHSSSGQTGTAEQEDVDEEEDERSYTPTKESFSVDLEAASSSSISNSLEYAAQLMNVFVLEFGIIFHSFFIGLTLACAGDEFISLYIVLVFHQMFEGLGLGSRIAVVDWSRTKSNRWTPWLLCLAFTLTTPIAIAIGLGIRKSYPPGSRKALITTGVFDSISAGILIYTGLIELMAHEFLFSQEFKGPGGFRKMIYAYFIMLLGAGLMALLGRWA